MESQLFIPKKYSSLLFGILVFLGLYLTSLYHYLLFHSIAEIFSIVVACGIFMITWNSRRFLDNNYLLFIGIAYLFIGAIDLIHTLAYKGMGVFQGFETNLPTQLWIGARYFESLSLLIAPFFLRRKLKINFVFLGYTIATSLLLASIFYWDIFPICFVESVGLTLFKKISEYTISCILLASIFFLLDNRGEFNRNVLQWLVWSIILTIASELSFTFYIHAYGFSSLVGHYFKIISFYFIYKALIETGLTRPYALLFRNLKRSEERFRNIFEKSPIGIELYDSTGQLVEVNKSCLEIFGVSDQANVKGSRLFGDPNLPGELKEGLRNGEVFRYEASFDFEKVKGHKLYESKKSGIIYLDVLITSLGLKEKEGSSGYLVQIQDVTEHKRIEEAIRRSRDELEMQVEKRTVELAKTDIELQSEIIERKRSEEARRETEKRYRLLVETMNEGLRVIDENGLLTYVNEGFSKMLGYSKDEMTGHLQIDFVAQEYKDMFKNQMALRKGGKEEPYEISFMRKEGGKISTIISPKPIFDDDGHFKGSFALITDITERKEIERRTHATNALLNLFAKESSRKKYLDEVVNLISSWSGSRCVGIRILDERGYIPYESYVGFSREFWESENWLSVKHNQCACIRVITGELNPQDAPVVTLGGSFCCGNTVEFVNKLLEDGKSRYRGVCVENGFFSVAIIPIRYREKIFGAIHLADERKNNVPLKTIESIESMAPLIGEAVHRFNLEDELRESENRLRLLSSELLTVQESERKRVARELHDGIGQTLAAIKFGLESKLSQMGKRSAPPGVLLESIISLAQSGIEESRRIQMDLRPSILDDLGILATIGWFTREFQKVYSHIFVEKRIDSDENEIPDPLRIVLFRVIQEAMNNIAKHSNGNLVRLSLRKIGKKIELTIEDNGAGFDPEKSRKGLGLTSMRERVELSGGTFFIESTPGKGTMIKAIWPT